MTSLEHDDQVRNAVRRFKRFNLWAAIAIAALFGVLAVKSQILPSPSWHHAPHVYETAR